MSFKMSVPRRGDTAKTNGYVIPSRMIYSTKPHVDEPDYVIVEAFAYANATERNKIGRLERALECPELDRFKFLFPYTYIEPLDSGEIEYTATPAVDAEGDPILDAEGNPAFEPKLDAEGFEIPIMITEDAGDFDPATLTGDWRVDAYMLLNNGKYEIFTGATEQ